MRCRVAAYAAVLASCALVPLASAAQDAPRTHRRGILGPTLGGIVAGLGLAFAYMDQPGDGWLIDDATVLPLALTIGLGTAFTVRGASSGIGPSEGRRPRMRVAAGGGNGMSWDYSLGYRAPIRERVELEGIILVVTDTWEKTEVQTRCDVFFGCITGEFMTDWRYRQSVSAMVRGAFRLAESSTRSAALVLGAGPMLARDDSEGRPESKRTGLLLDGALAVEIGGRNRWVGEAGVRVVAAGGDWATRHYRGGWSLRLGRAFGY